MLERFKAFSRIRRNPRVERIAGLLLLLASLLFLSLFLVKSWPQVKPHLTHINLGLLAAGQVFTLVALFIGALMWSLIQEGSDLGFSRREGLAIHLVSGITKYIPGYAWQYLSKAYLSRKRGASSRCILAAMLVELVLLIAGGVLLAAAWGFGVGFSRPLAWLPAWGWLVVLVLTLLLVYVGIRVVARAGIIQNYSYSWTALTLAAAGWMMFALAAWLVARSLYPVTLQDLPQFVAALVFSGIVSLLVIIVPGGLGIRETAMAVLLAATMPLAVGAVVSILVRLTVILAELVAFAIVVKSGLAELPDRAMGELKAE